MAALTASRVAELEAIARRGRLLLVDTVAGARAGHLGGPLSAMDMLVALYFEVLRIDPGRPDWPERDRFVLSKGHSGVGLYTVLAMRGYFPESELTTFDTGDSRLQSHPDMRLTPGIDASVGSLGQGFSLALGIAMGLRRRGNPAHVFAMLGDGEMQEGQVWEAVHVAPRYGAGNLTAILDWNGMQQHGWRLEEGEVHRGSRRDPWAGVDLRTVLAAFGWRVLEIDGHDIAQVVAACEDARSTGAGSTPTMILAHTQKGRGISFTEGRAEWHARLLAADDHATARAELLAAGGDAGHAGDAMEAEADAAEAEA
jgi:transketolase